MSRSTRLVHSLLNTALRVWGMVAFYILPVLIERILLRLRPRETVRAVRPGSRRHPGGDWAILVVWQKHTWPWSLDNLMDALDRRGVNILVAANALPGIEHETTLLSRCATLLLRDNQGFDFGAYRDAVLHLLKTESPTRVLFANDSVFYYRNGIETLVARLLPAQGGADVIAAFENQERQYHFQSFLLSIAAPLLRREPVMNFWRRYIQVSNRRWCINHGEIPLSRQLLACGASFEVLASSAALATALATLPPRGVLALRPFVAAAWRADWDKLARLVEPEAVPGDTGLDTRHDLALAAVAICQRRSPVHCAPFIYARLLGMPVLKRDLVWRDCFTLTEIEVNLIASGLDERVADTVAEFRRRGRGIQLRGADRARYAVSVL